MYLFALVALFFHQTLLCLWSPLVLLDQEGPLDLQAHPFRLVLLLLALHGVLGVQVIHFSLFALSTPFLQRFLIYLVVLVVQLVQKAQLDLVGQVYQPVLDDPFLLGGPQAPMGLVIQESHVLLDFLVYHLLLLYLSVPQYLMALADQ